ncbi:MAG: RNA 2',3'-cyclic phosphodiesterase [Spirochaetes bacterium]|nr:RNA 2',3'-cyclic phosphodiesterase [Spirochaetota bacterium]NLJ04319.1 RNA 2',3'-cyclic phosphodiesterase [Exilispira sp.]MBP8991767.1 RNA 2',3'-cyclic phosphodiesterase [Spirochaetota bacterium]HOV45882.1 RNA 2',3'-cyclic phosphodiesterase [Exilispira sp.]HPO60713.1 RNA 2',3'-cyclic phosphodiesterase [Exilispira sp.]
MRLFLAYRIDNFTINKIKKFSDELKNNLNYSNINNSMIRINWVDPCDMHITIQFIPQYDPQKIIDTLINSKHSFSLENYNFKLNGLQAFPDTRQPSVLILPVEDSSNVFSSVAYDLFNILEKLGLEGEKRKFKPHITLARIKYKQCIKDDLNNRSKLNLRNNDFKEFKIFLNFPWGRLSMDNNTENISMESFSFKGSKLFLFQSILTPQKPIYKELYSFD